MNRPRTLLYLSELLFAFHCTSRYITKKKMLPCFQKLGSGDSMGTVVNVKPLFHDHAQYILECHLKIPFAFPFLILCYASLIKANSMDHCSLHFKLSFIDLGVVQCSSHWTLYINCHVSNFILTYASLSYGLFMLN